VYGSFDEFRRQLISSSRGVPALWSGVRALPDADLRTDPLKRRSVCDLRGDPRHPADEREDMPELK